MSKKVWVRIINKQVEQFFRAGEKFTRDWKQVTLGEAEVTAIEHDQMLQISFTNPVGDADYPDDLKTQLGLLLTVYSAQEIADGINGLKPDWAGKMNRGVEATAAASEAEAQAIAAAPEPVAQAIAAASEAEAQATAAASEAEAQATAAASEAEAQATAAASEAEAQATAAASEAQATAEKTKTKNLKGA